MRAKVVFIRSALNYDADEVSQETGVNNIDPETGEEMPSLTQQSFKDDADINEIVRRFGITGQLPDNISMPVSGDFTGITDFQSAMQLVTQANEEFMKLPADVRDRFANDPARVIAFLDQPANREEAIKLGLVAAPPEKTRDAVQAIDDLASKIVAPVK